MHMRNRLTAIAAGILMVLAGSLFGATPAQAVNTYFYAVGEQTGIVADGAAVNISVHSPYVNLAHDGNSAHSIGELAVRSADLKNRIEVGWRKGTSGNLTLFVYHAVNGVAQGYNLCTDYASEPFNAGDTIPVSMLGTSPRFQIVHSGTRWWVQFNAKWVCTFPDTLWTSQGQTFNKVNIVQAYGEVVSALTATPCTDMGWGDPASWPSAARIENYALQGQTSGPPAAFLVYANPTGVGITTQVINSTGFSYGWAGYSSTNTLPGNLQSC